MIFYNNTYIRYYSMYLLYFLNKPVVEIPLLLKANFACLKSILGELIVVNTVHLLTLQGLPTGTFDMKTRMQ